jgi:hypothetical protein
MELNKDFKEFIELLNEHEVQYLVVGGYAVNFHGYPRYTKDIDLWIWLDANNIDNLISTIKSFGFGNLGLSKEDFSDPENIIQLGYEPHRIDLMMDIEGVDFEASYKHKEVVELDDVPVNFISLDDLIKVKTETGRLQDLADAEQLKKIKEKKEEG